MLHCPPSAPAGATWADQLLWPKRYVNQGWTVVILLVVTAIFVVMSLLPLLDPWYMCTALLTGARPGAWVLCCLRWQPCGSLF